LPSSFALMVKTSEGVRRTITLRTGPCSPALSVYLKPYGPSAFQNVRPELLSPCGSGKSCIVELLPLAMTVRRAPPALPATVGSPTRVLVLAASRALPVTFRLDGSPGSGFFTTIDLPRIV